MRKLLSLLALAPLAAQAQVPTPAAPQAAPIVLVGGTLHTGTGQVIDNAAVAFDKGRLVYAGPRSGFMQAGYQARDISGQHVYPGLILPNTTLGLSEIEAIRATVDDREVGDLNPNVRALIAFNTDSEVLPTVRLNGVLLAQPTPRGGLVTGQSAIVQLDAWNWQDAVVKADDGIHLTWPEMVIKTNPAEDAAQLTRR
ncbi:MAG: amidohydrolase, partial [Hymenobacter sp.]